MKEIVFNYEMVTSNGDIIQTKSVKSQNLNKVMAKVVETLNNYPNTTLNMLEAHLEDGKVIKNRDRLQTLDVMITLVAEHINQTNKKKKPIAENLRTVLSNPKKAKKLLDILEDRKPLKELDLPSLDKGDILLVGKFKNRRAVIDDFETDDKGQPIAKTDKGDQKIFKPRIAKLMPGVDSKDTNAEEPLVKDVEEAEIVDKIGKKTKQTKGQFVVRPLSAN